MAKLNLTQAAKRVGITRQTLYNHIKIKGISTTKNDKGHKLIDLAELARVYPDCNVLDDKQDVKNLHDHTPKNTHEDSALRAKLDVMTQEKIEALEKALDAAEKQRDEWMEQAKTSRLLLTHSETQKEQPPATVPEPPVKSRWWKVW